MHICWLCFQYQLLYKINLEIDFTKIINLLDIKSKDMFCNFIDRLYSLLLLIAVDSSFESLITQKI